MSQANNAFYGWENWETTGNPNIHTADDNPTFSSGYYSRVPEGSPLRKGYMRSATPEKYGKTRFHFQFNPNTIVRSTTVNQDMLGIANLTPQEISVAGLASGGAGFGFALLLDRQDEVAANQFGGIGASLGFGSSKNKDPSLGVLVDIEALDKVAGIGQTAAAVDAVNSGGWGAGTIWSAPNTEGVTDMGAGNQAFMLSYQPVRVVFSRNLIVEGFLQQVDVSYTKFNRFMVPTMATVQCSMQAFYIGAATASTWWSEAVSNTDLTNSGRTGIGANDSPGQTSVPGFTINTGPAEQSYGGAQTPVTPSGTVVVNQHTSFN